MEKVDRENYIISTLDFYTRIHYYVTYILHV